MLKFTCEKTPLFSAVAVASRTVAQKSPISVLEGVHICAEQDALSLTGYDLENGITVTIPAAEIQGVDIDPESFQLYSEKAGLGNHISAEDFNNSLVELEATAREKAIERGVLDRADENARVLIRNLIGALVDLNAYSLEFVTQR